MTGPPSHRTAGFFVLRTPFDPFDTLERWRSASDAASGEGLDGAVVRLRADLVAQLDRPELAEALLLASRDLVENTRGWLADPDSERSRRAEPTLVRYVSRMAGRCTPFGLFAGVSLGRVEPSTQLDLGPRGDYRRVTVPDFRCSLALLEALRDDPVVRAQLRYRPNPTLYGLGPRLRFVDRRITPKGLSYFLSSIESSAEIERVLDSARKGVTVASLVAELSAEDDHAGATGRLVGALIADGVLLDDLEPLVTGTDPLAALNGLIAAGSPAAEGFLAAARLIAEGDARGIGLPSDFYRALERALPAPESLGTARPVFVGLVKPAPDLTLSDAVAAEVLKGVKLLHAIGDARDDYDELTTFRAAFVARYGEGRMTSLLEVMDPEGGIGFGAQERVPESAQIVQGLGLTRRATSTEGPAWSKRDAHLLGLLERAWRMRAGVIELGEADVAALSTDSTDDLPDAFCAMFALDSPSAQDVDRGDFRILLKMAFGPSGASILGRPASLDPELREALRGFLRAEEALRPDEVFAEIVHLPDADMGNLVFRPVLRGHEIPVWGGSGIAQDRQLAMSELAVTVQGDRIVLYSERLAAEVVPRLTSAHNYALSHLDVYRFLCMLQHQGVRGFVDWSWGCLGHAAFLPRVATGRLILARARWRLEREHLDTWSAQSRSERLGAFERWRVASDLPRFVLQVDDDLELPVDTSNPLAVEALLMHGARKHELVLEEMIPAPGRLAVSGPEGRYVHEAVLPFVRAEARRAAPRPATRTASGRRSFMPWSEWMYLKLYAGEHAADVLLVDVVGPLAAELKDEGLIDRWHFLRYADPETHVRLRLHSCDPALWSARRIQTAIEQATSDGIVRDAQVSTYLPEIERYGGPCAIELAEAAFDADSEASVAILTMLRRSGQAASFGRWKAVALGVDRLLSDFGFDLAAKASACEQMSDTYRAEFKVTARQRRAIGQRYRTLRPELEQALDRRDHDPQPAFLEKALGYRSSRLAPVVDRLRVLEREGQLADSLENIVLSLTHMHANRMLPAFQREQELIVYDFLCRAYESRRARARGVAPDPG